MNDAVKPAVSDEMVEAACRAVVMGEDERGRSVYLTPNEARAAISAALTAQGQGPVAVSDALINEIMWRISNVHDLRDQELRAKIERQVKGAVIDHVALAAPAQPVDPDEELYEIGVREGYERAVQEIDQLTGGDGEYRYCTDRDPERHTPDAPSMIQRIVDRFETLNLLNEATATGSDEPDDGPFAPAQPVGVPVGYVSTVELHTLRNIDTCVDLFSMPPDEDGFQFVPVYAAPQPPAEGGWKPMEQIGNLLRQHIEAGESHGGRYDSE